LTHLGRCTTFAVSAAKGEFAVLVERRPGKPGQLLAVRALGLVVVACASAASAVASEASSRATVVRVYDVRITGETKLATSEHFVGSDNCVKTLTASGRQTWSSFHRGVRVTFTSARLGPLTPTTKVGRMVRTVRYSDNGGLCGPTPDPPCEFAQKQTVSSLFSVRQPGQSGEDRSYLLGFDMFGRSSSWPTPCEAHNSDVSDGLAIDITRRRRDSSYRVNSSFWLYTFLSTSTKWRPTLARLPYPFNMLYAGKPVTIRVTDTKDESRSVNSFSGSVTIVFTPRSGR
jgi:hypothetical protein